MKSKNLTIALFFLIFLIAILLFLIAKKNDTPQSCATNIHSVFTLPNGNSSYKVYMKITKNSDNSGNIKLLGAITVDKTYSINRVINLNLTPSKDSNDLELRITHERKAKNDNVSDEIFNQYFKVFSLGSTGYVKINEITPEWYLFSSSFGPYFACTLQDEPNAI